jgi:hypothetical protein
LSLDLSQFFAGDLSVLGFIGGHRFGERTLPKLLARSVREPGRDIALSLLGRCELYLIGQRRRERNRELSRGWSP